MMIMNTEWMVGSSRGGGFYKFARVCFAHALPLKVCIKDLSPNRLVVGGVEGVGVARLAAAAWSATAIPILVNFLAVLTCFSRELEMGGATVIPCKAVVESVSVSAPSAECIRPRDSSEGWTTGVRARAMPNEDASPASVASRGT